MGAGSYIIFLGEVSPRASLFVKTGFAAFGGSHIFQSTY